MTCTIKQEVKTESEVGLAAGECEDEILSYLRDKHLVSFYIDFCAAAL